MQAVLHTPYTPQKLAVGDFFEGIKPIRYADMFCG